jgi:hypothetical protein
MSGHAGMTGIEADVRESARTLAENLDELRTGRPQR